MKEMKTYLRALQLDDYKTTINWRNDDKMWAMVTGPKYFVSPDYEKKWVEEAIFDKKSFHLAICVKENDTMIGLSTLDEIDWINRTARIGVLIGDKKYWGRDYAIEACILIGKFALLDRGLHRASYAILEYNKASRSVAEKCGAIQEGILREALFKNGKFHNLVVYSHLADEFLEYIKQNDFI
jgi:RimJ/RimL family protein N-acetyltransferase